MKPEDIVALMIPVTFLVMLGMEVIFKTGRSRPQIPWWRAKGIAFFNMLMTLSAIRLSLVPPEMAQHHLFDGARLGVAGGALLGYLVVSLAAACAGYIAAFYGMFQHLNVRTPRWVGYLIQRPESHGVHHRRGYHSYNYSDLPIWDMLWGTFRNPPQ